MRRVAMILALALLVAACPRPKPTYHWSPVAYRARSIEVVDAFEWFQRLMLTGRELSPFRVDVNRHYAILYFYKGQPGQLRFDEIASAHVLRAAETGDFDVELRDAHGRPLYRYTATTEERAQVFVDAVTTLTAAR